MHKCKQLYSVCEKIFFSLLIFSGKGDLQVLEVKSNTQAPCEATNKEAFFSRVESYSISFYSFWSSVTAEFFFLYIYNLAQLGDVWKWVIALVCVWLMLSLARHCLKWAGKPRVLSPLMCARYGWINVGCDMLKCSSCQAFLCASLQPTLDFKKCEQNFVTTEKTLYLYQGQAAVVSLPRKI